MPQIFLIVNLQVYPKQARTLKRHYLQDSVILDLEYHRLAILGHTVLLMDLQMITLEGLR